MLYPVAKLQLLKDKIHIRLYDHPEIEKLDSAEIIKRCKDYDAYLVEIELTHLHIVQLVHDLEQEGYRVSWIKPVSQ